MNHSTMDFLDVPEAISTWKIEKLETERRAIREPPSVVHFHDKCRPSHRRFAMNLFKRAYTPRKRGDLDSADVMGGEARTACNERFDYSAILLGPNLQFFESPQ